MFVSSKMPESINQPNVISGKETLYNPPIKISPPLEGVEFGKYCAIAPNLKIFGTNHDYNFLAVQSTFYKKHFNQQHPGGKSRTLVRSKGKIKIGNDVWIGEDVCIMSGVTIGDGCCIGARSVVTKNLEPYSICVGSPCKEVKKRYSQKIIDFLTELKWWDWDDSRISQNLKLFTTNINTVSLDELRSIII
jgi:acetyltransferase-like isoleucine patch superfamily enzyme